MNFFKLFRRATSYNVFFVFGFENVRLKQLFCLIEKHL